ncbi:MAG: hypothetical protein WKF93_06775 [Acidimicrobiales bacterium]
MVRIVAAMALVFGLLVVGSTAATAQDYGGMTPTTVDRNPPGGGGGSTTGGGGGSTSGGASRGSGPLARTGTDLIVPLAATGIVVAGIGAIFVVAAHQRRRTMA